MLSINDFTKTIKYRYSGLNKLKYTTNDLIILGARPNIGKTTLSLNLAEEQLKKGIKVGYFTLEMSKNLILNKINPLPPIFTTKNVLEYAYKAEHLIDNFYLEDAEYDDINLLEAKIRKLKQKDVKIIYIDYLGLIKDKNAKNALNRREFISNITKRLKKLANELDIPIFVLSQLNRNAETEEPTLADLRDSGAVEEDADLVLFLTRNRKNKKIVSSSKLIVAKNRNGKSGNTIDLLFYSPSLKFIEKNIDIEAIYDKR